MYKIDDEYKKSIVFLFQWMIISVTAGITGSLLVAFFFHMVTIGGHFVHSINIPLPLWTIGGALICGSIFYRISPSASGDGIPSYIKGVLDKEGIYSFKETLSKFAATLVALVTLSSGGMLGPAGRVAAGLNSQLARMLADAGVIREKRRIAAICGMSAAVGAMFHSPVGGGIFAVEVLQKANMKYSDLFPAILSSSVSVYIYNFFPISSPLSFSAPIGIFDKTLMIPILITALAAAFAGRLYTLFFNYVSSLFSKGNSRKVILKLFLGAITASSIIYFFSPEMAGNIRGVTDSISSGILFPVNSLFVSFPVLLLYVLFILVIAVASSVSIASGISVGMTSPSILIGLFLGAAMAVLFGVEPSDPVYFFFLVAGFSGLLSSTINVPVGAAVIAIESFGASYGFCAGISSIIGFQVNRHHTLYDHSI